MAFEPLLTDEKLDKPPPKKSDMDSLMIAGCTGFVATSIIAYVLSVWPHFVVGEAHLARSIGIALAIGLMPALIFGFVAIKKMGLPAATGFIGGSLATGVFLFLRINQVMISRHIHDGPQPDYPAAWTWMIPAGWVVLATIFALIITPRSEFSVEED
jgi:hypothetical protein